MSATEQKVTSAILFCDGAARQNPGPAAAGYVLFADCDAAGAEMPNLPDVVKADSAALAKSAQLLSSGGWGLGEQTNNFAEYWGLIWGMQNALHLGIEKLSVRMDSNLVVQQMTGEYKVKSPQIKPLFAIAQRVRGQFSNIEFEHVYREFNTLADNMGNQALDAGAPVGNYFVDLVLPDSAVTESLF